MDKITDFIILFLSQFAGGPGPAENNLVRFGLPAIMWAVLFRIAWSRRKSQENGRENLLIWGFGLASLRELYMFGQMVWKLVDTANYEASCRVVQPFEHALSMAAMIMVSGAFLRYLLRDEKISRIYLGSGLGITALVFSFASINWPRQMEADPQVLFHQTQSAWLFHIPLSAFLVVSVILMFRHKGWVRNAVAGALVLDFLSEILLLANYATDQAFNRVICPIGNSMHILAIPIFGYVYLREQAIEKKRAEDELIAYRDHLEELVDVRTRELTSVNAHLEQEVIERTAAEQAVKRVNRQNETVLASAGEGICGIDLQGSFVFVNPAAARMLGYAQADLIGESSHAIWHTPVNGRGLHSVGACPVVKGYTVGLQRFGDDEYFARKDGSVFPVRYFSNPTWEDGALTGSVVVFQDITERRKNELEIAQRNASLAAQNAAAERLSQSLDIDENVSAVLDMVCRETELEIGLVYLLNADSGKLALHLQRNGSGPGSEPTIKHDDCGWMQLAGKTLQAERTRPPRLTVLSKRESAALCADADIRSVICLPLVSKGRATGLMILASSTTTTILPFMLDTLLAISRQIGMAIDNARMYHEAEKRGRQLVRLNRASSFLNTSIELKQVNAEIAKQFTWLAECSKACVVSWPHQARTVSLAAHHGFDPAEVRFLLEQLPTWELWPGLFAQPRTVEFQDAHSDLGIPEAFRSAFDVRSMLIIPVWRSDKPQEFIVLISSTASRRWHPQDLELLESLANRAAIALVNADLSHQIQLSAALEERQRIAANMHDGLAQTLSLLGLSVDGVQQLINDGRVQEAELSVRKIREVVTRASGEVRSSIASLQQAPRPRSSLQALLRNLVESHKMPDGTDLVYISEAGDELYPPDFKIDQILLIAQEALLNACRHAGARRITLRLHAEGPAVCITIEDDGSGFDPASAKNMKNHFGLSIMQARAARIDGTMRIEASPGKGTVVLLSVLLDALDQRKTHPAEPESGVVRQTG